MTIRSTPMASVLKTITFVPGAQAVVTAAQRGTKVTIKSEKSI